MTSVSVVANTATTHARGRAGDGILRISSTGAAALKGHKEKDTCI